MNDLLRHLGRRADDPSLLQLLADNSISAQDELELPAGEFNAYIERPAQGYALVFTDEAVFRGDIHAPIGIGPLCLSGIFIYLTNIDEYKEFGGSLPFDLPKPLNRDVLGRAFGGSDWRAATGNGHLAAERWDIGTDRRIQASYQQDGHQVSVLSVSQPDAQAAS